MCTSGSLTSLPRCSRSILQPIPTLLTHTWVHVLAAQRPIFSFGIELQFFYAVDLTFLLDSSNESRHKEILSKSLPEETETQLLIIS